MVNGYSPESLKEALEIRKSKKVIPLAGGTDLMVKRKNCSGLSPKFEEDVLFIGHLKELKNIKLEKNHLKIGATCTLIEMVESEIVPGYIKNVLLNMASPSIRNIATMGGNICNASPAGDTLPFLYAMNANLIVGNLERDRKIKIEDFIYEPGKNNLREDELLKEIMIPIEDFGFVFYKKVGTRKANCLSKASFIGAGKINDKRIEDIRIAFGAISPRVIRDRKIEEKLKGINKKELKENIQKIKTMYSQLINPIDDQRSSKEYRKKVSLRLLETFLLKDMGL